MFCNWGVLGPGFVATQAVIPAIQRPRNGRVRALASREQARAQRLPDQSFHFEKDRKRRRKTRRTARCDHLTL